MLIRKIREESGFTQREFARKARISVRTLQSLERGKKIQRPIGRRILQALGIPFSPEAVRQIFGDRCA